LNTDQVFSVFMSKGLTKRQNELLTFLRQVHDKTGLMPSTREIQDHFGFSSQTAAMGHLRALEKKGIITRIPGKARAIMFANHKQPDGNQTTQSGQVNISKITQDDHLVTIPLYGDIAAGMTQANEVMKEGEITLDPILFGLANRKNLFGLRVKGESMIDAHICDGDTVILEKRMPRNGDIVAALMDGGTTLKRYIERDGQTYLKAENPSFPDLHPVEELQIQGVLITLIRDRF